MANIPSYSELGLYKKEKDRLEVLKRALESSLMPDLQEYRDDDHYLDLVREDAIVRRQISDYDKLINVWEKLIKEAEERNESRNRGRDRGVSH